MAAHPRAHLTYDTGTGVTGALLAELVGPSGHVVSVDIDPSLTCRAAELHAERCVRNVTLVAGDGNQGAPGHGPFDVIIAWATPVVIPWAWLDHAKLGPVICTPVYFDETARSTAHVRATVTASRSLTAITLGSASYVDMGGEINTNFKVPMFYIDTTRDCDGKPAWISVAWRGRHPDHDADRSLAMLTTPGYREPCGLARDPEDHRQAWRDFRAYCAALGNGTNLTSHGTSAGDNTIGFSSGNNAAVLTDSGIIIANTASSPALGKLRDYLSDWEHSGRIGLSGMVPVAEDTTDGWTIRLRLPSTARR